MKTDTTEKAELKTLAELGGDDPECARDAESGLADLDAVSAMSTHIIQLPEGVQLQAVTPSELDAASRIFARWLHEHPEFEQLVCKRTPPDGSEADLPANDGLALGRDGDVVGAITLFDSSSGASPSPSPDPGRSVF